MATTRKRVRVGSKGSTPAERSETASRHARVVELANAGWTQEAIAAEVGYADKSSVRFVLDKWIAANGPTREAVEELRQRQLAQLNSLHKALWPHLEKSLRAEDGTIVRGDDGAPIVVPDLAVVDRLVRVMERTSRLGGLDLQPGMQVNVGISAEAIAAYLGWDPQPGVQDVEVEEMPGDTRALLARSVG